MNKKLGSILQYILFLGIGIFLVWWSLQQIPADKWGEFKAALTNARYWLILPVFLILTGSHVLRALRWKILIEPMGYRPSLANAFFAVMVGYLANLAVPRLGEVLKCTILARYEKVPAQKLVGTIVAERAFDVISLALVFVLAFILQFDIVGQYAISLFQNAFQDKAGHINANKLVIILCVIIAIIGAIIYWFKQFAHLAIVEKVKHIFLGVW
ncbi:MAG TPA: TIGR00374 family protein, partial [Chitinophagaceae bacterium]|nr:TIGR00374 family protein [Chitinophagaceae bacterium]